MLYKGSLFQRVPIPVIKAPTLLQELAQNTCVRRLLSPLDMKAYLFRSKEACDDNLLF